MFTENAVQTKVMCMMDKEMRMCMSDYASTYRKLPGASEGQCRMDWMRCRECEYRCIGEIRCRLHKQENPTGFLFFCVIGNYSVIFLLHKKCCLLSEIWGWNVTIWQAIRLYKWIWKIKNWIEKMKIIDK